MYREPRVCGVIVPRLLLIYFNWRTFRGHYTRARRTRLVPIGYFLTTMYYVRAHDKPVSRTGTRVNRSTKFYFVHPLAVDFGVSRFLRLYIYIRVIIRHEMDLFYIYYYYYFASRDVWKKTHNRNRIIRRQQIAQTIFQTVMYYYIYHIIMYGHTCTTHKPVYKRAQNNASTRNGTYIT